MLLVVIQKYHLLLGNPHPPFIIKTIYDDCYLSFLTLVQTGKAQFDYKICKGIFNLDGPEYAKKKKKKVRRVSLL